MNIDQHFDKMYMQYALSLARKGWGNTSINPLVGAVVVNHGRIVGQGYHRKIGEAHAEAVALADAGARARNATLYVTLEPCCCEGRTPACTRAIIRFKITRVVVSTIDPNPLVNGKGIDALIKQGIRVDTDVCQDEAEELNAGYFKYVTTRIPYVIMKIAMSENGKLSGYKNKYVTSPASQRYVHSLRSQVSAVLVGIGTVLKDNPYLTDRFVKRHDPARVIIDPQLEIPLHSHVLEPSARRIIFTSCTNQTKLDRIRVTGAEILQLSGDSYAFTDILKTLGQMEIGSVLVEGGGSIFTQFFEENLYDEIYLFVAPVTVPEGLDLNEGIKQKVIGNGSMYLLIGKDELFHVYRHN
jgi:diaminohydroxyphosphoribosylaminopyrimidine deaminase/5-amino-6-(5-phosphoribosylamino)uracil reductase